MRRKLGENLQQRVVSRRRKRPPVVSAIMCVPKEGSSDKYRMVEHMSHFKLNFEKVHFKMETMSHFSTIFGPRFFLFKLDFKSAYHNFLVRSTLRGPFAVEFEGEFYTYNALPFGFRLPVRYRNYCVRRWESLGLRFSHASGRCWLTPTQSLEGPGIVVHLAAACPTFHVPVRKVDVYLAESRALLDLEDLWPILKLARLAGLLMSAALAIPVSKLLCRPLFECMYVGTGERPESKRIVWTTLFGRLLACATSSNGSSLTCLIRTAAVRPSGWTRPSQSCPQPAPFLSFRRTLRCVALVGWSTARTPRLSPLSPPPRCLLYRGSTSLARHPAVPPSCVPTRSTHWQWSFLSIPCPKRSSPLHPLLLCDSGRVLYHRIVGD